MRSNCAFRGCCYFQLLLFVLFFVNRWWQVKVVSGGERKETGMDERKGVVGYSVRFKV